MSTQTDDSDALQNVWAEQDKSKSDSNLMHKEDDQHKQYRTTSGDSLSSLDNIRAHWSASPEPNAHLSTSEQSAGKLDSLTTQFDEFDPFRPDKPHYDHNEANEDVSPADGTNRGSDVDKNAWNETPASGKGAEAPIAIASEDLPAWTPSDTPAPSPPAKEPSQHSSGIIGQQQNAAKRPPEDKNKNAELPQASSMTPSTSSSGLSNPLATIASAFRKRDFSSNKSSSSNPASPARAETPIGKPAPAILVRDRDDMADIDDSEKEAPPAVPSVSGSHGHDGNEEADGTPAFDFNHFLEQMRSRAAEPIAKYLRSFLREFNKRQWGVNEQIRVINDFLDFIAIKMRENEIWKTDTEKEFENAVEGMEKLVMNRVFHLTFIPALDPSQQATTQTDDLERDHVLDQRIKLFQWVSEEHLDLPQHKDTASFVEFAKQELRKVNAYKAPRDKLICILNSCKVIFGLMRHLSLEDGADTFIPFLILVVLRANPDHLISNVQYIQRFRNPDRLAGENGYYLSSLNAAISFIETMDSSSLSNISQEEFERAVEQAIRSLPSEHDQYLPPAAVSSSSATTTPSASAPQAFANFAVPQHQHAEMQPSAEKRLSQQMALPYNDVPPRSQSPAEATRDFFIRSSDNLQKTVSKPLQALGKIFTEMGSESEMIAGYPGHGQQQSRGGHPPLSPQQPQQTPRGQRPPSQRTRSQASLASPISPPARQSRLPPAGYTPEYAQGMPQQQVRPAQGSRPSSYQPADFLDDSVSAQDVQAVADRNYKANFDAKIDTLASIFPGIERETLEIVLLSNGEEVERTIEGLLEMQ